MTPELNGRRFTMGDCRLISQQDAEDLVRGATMFGTGGGGSPEEGRRALAEVLAGGLTVGWVDPESIPDGDYTMCVSFMGNRAGLTPEDEGKKLALGLTDFTYPDNMHKAAEVLMEELGFRPKYVVCPELGGSNTPVPLCTAARLGMLVADGDYAGRAVPEIAQCTPCLYGLPILPMVSVDKWGDITVMRAARSCGMAERVGKMLAMAAFGNTALAGFVLSGRDTRRVLVRDTLSESLQVGRAIREALENGRDPVDAGARATRGKVRFVGELARTDAGVVDGYYQGYHRFVGHGEWQGQEARVWFRNENHVMWVGDLVVATSPDLIMQMDPSCGEPVPNHSLELGRSVALLVAPARKVHRSPEAIERLGPRHYGFDIDYRPVSDTAGDGGE